MDGRLRRAMCRDKYICHANPTLSHSAHYYFQHTSFFVYMELSPLMFQRNLSTNFSSSDIAFWMTATETAAASYLSSGRPMLAILSAVSSSLSDPYKVSRFSRSWASVHTLL